MLDEYCASTGLKIQHTVDTALACFLDRAARKTAR